MSEHRIQTVEFDKFQSVVNGFIDRSSQEYDEMPVASFFELLLEKMVKRIQETIELESEIVDNRLVN